MRSPKAMQLLCLSLGLYLANCTPALADCRPEEATQASSEKAKELLGMSLEDLLAVKVIQVTTVSKKSEDVFNAPGVISIVTAEEIEQFGANNLSQVLERVTSVYPTGAYMFPNNAMSIRGDSTSGMDTHVLLLLNGRPFKDGLVGGLNYPIYLAYPISAIERIEIIRGPGSVLYGTNAFAGVINLITKTALAQDQPQKTRVKIGAGSLGTKTVEAYSATCKDDLNLVGAVKSFREAGWNFQATDELGVLGNTDYYQANDGLFLYGDYRDWTLNFSYLRSVQRHWGELPQWSWQATDIDDRRLLLDLGYAHEVNDKWKLQANFTYNNTDDSFESVVANTQESSEDLQLELTGLWSTNNFSWLFGGTALRTNAYTTGYPKDAPAGTEMPLLAKNYENWFTLYTQLDYHFSDKLSLITGTQWVKSAGLDWNSVPRLGLIWHFNEHWGAKALYSRAYRGAFEFENNVNSPVVIGDPNLRPETIDTYDLQLMYRIKSYEASLTYFHSQEQDLISVAPVPALNLIQYTNQGKISLQGLEFEFKAKPAERLYLTGSLSYQENENDTGIQNYTLIPNLFAKLGVNYDFSQNISLGVFNHYVSHAHDVGIRVANVQYVNPSPEAYNLVTLNLKLDLGDLTQWTRRDELLLNMYVYNLLDEDVYQPEAVRSQINSIPTKQGRGVYLNVNYLF